MGEGQGCRQGNFNQRGKLGDTVSVSDTRDVSRQHDLNRCRHDMPCGFLQKCKAGSVEWAASAIQFAKHAELACPVQPIEVWLACTSRVTSLYPEDVGSAFHIISQSQNIHAPALDLHSCA